MYKIINNFHCKKKTITINEVIPTGYPFRLFPQHSVLLTLTIVPSPNSTKQKYVKPSRTPRARQHFSGKD